MAYHIYNTEGFIISYANLGEANRLYTIFTKDFGLINARAVSVRKISSKLKFSLEKLSQSRISIIRVGEMWQIIDSEEKNPPPKKNIHKSIYTNTLALIKRFSGFNLEHGQLYNDIDDFLLFLKKNNISDEDIKLFEIIIVLIVLFHLGYVSQQNNSFISMLLDRGFIWNKDTLLHIKKNKNIYIKTINESINATQL